MPDADTAARSLLRFRDAWEALPAAAGSIPPAHRVLAALAGRGPSTATDLAAALPLDPGHLSRVVASLRRRRLLGRRRSRSDRREATLAITAAGRRSLRTAERRTLRAAGALLEAVPAEARPRLARALDAAGAILAGKPPSRSPVVLRPHRPGDLGWLVHRHGVLHARERGWGGTFEGIVARVASDFLRRNDPRRERCWVADRDGEPVAGVLLVRRSRHLAQLRLLLVEPGARGGGIGRLLVEECLRFATEAGYRRVVLWTDASLGEARNLYEGAGFRRVARKRHSEYGRRQVAERWERRVP